MIARGTIGQNKQLDYIMRTMEDITVKVPLLNDAVGVQYPPSQESMESTFSDPYFEEIAKQPLEDNFHKYSETAKMVPTKTFGNKEYDVAICWEKTLCCTSQDLKFDPEMVHYRFQMCCDPNMYPMYLIIFSTSLSAVG